MCVPCLTPPADKFSHEEIDILINVGYALAAFKHVKVRIGDGARACSTSTPNSHIQTSLSSLTEALQSSDLAVPFAWPRKETEMSVANIQAKLKNSASLLKGHETAHLESFFDKWKSWLHPTATPDQPE